MNILTKQANRQRRESGRLDGRHETFPVDKREVLKKAKVGDTIMATVYKGDITLHNVQVMPAGKSDTKKPK